MTPPPFGLPVGWTAGGSPRLGFAPPAAARMLRHAGDGHLLTVAPTGAGKGRCGVIPALLTHPGPTLTIDVKGENYAVTARARRAMGHRVVAIDPFRLSVPEPDSLDLLALGAGPWAVGVRG